MAGGLGVGSYRLSMSIPTLIMHTVLPVMYMGVCIIPCFPRICPVNSTAILILLLQLPRIVITQH